MIQNMSSGVICRFVFALCYILTLLNFGNSEETKIINAVEFDPDTYLPTNKIIERHGYPCESHEVTTKDGYILTLHRIPYGRKSFGRKRSSTTLPPVFFQHGILGSSADWIINGPERSLAYQLADKGHDVWLGNVRGNTYSRGHVSLSPDNSAFWNFTFHEMGTRDLPTMIDFILETTGHDKLYYIGHSMGTTVFYVLCSMRPEYNEKIVMMFTLAPVAFMSNAESPIRYFAPYSKDIQLISKWFGDGEFLPRNAFINFVLKYGCEISSLEIKLCENNLFIICGHDPVQFNKSLIPVIFGHTPAGTSTKTLAHFAQEIQSGYFRQFDYGSEHNPSIYDGSVEPPSYDLSKVTAPISLHFADNDLLANPKDVKKLAESLPNVIALMRVDFHLFNHLDFLWCKDVNHLLNDKILSMIDTIETDGVIPKIPYSLEDMSEKLADDEPVFNDISSLLKHKVKKASQGYLDGVLNIKMSAERKLTNLKTKTKNTIKRKLKSITNIFQNMLGTDIGEPVYNDKHESEGANLSVENENSKSDNEMEVINGNSLSITD